MGSYILRFTLFYRIKLILQNEIICANNNLSVAIKKIARVKFSLPSKIISKNLNQWPSLLVLSIDEEILCKCFDKCCKA